LCHYAPVADKGTGNTTCGDEDWVELHNYGMSAMDLAGWFLADEKGVFHEDVHLVGKNKVIAAGVGLVQGECSLMPIARKRLVSTPEPINK
jgi:hypothetical protein